MGKKLLNIGRMTGFGAWSLLVLFYFYRHFPFIHLREVVFDGLLLLFLLLVLTAVGRFVLKRFQPEWHSLEEEVCFSFGIGSATLMGLIFALATVHLLYEPLIVALVLVLALVSYNDAKYFCLSIYQRLKSGGNPLFSLQERILLGLMGIGLGLTFLAAATPPFFFDALSYHLAVPDQYLRHHGFYPMPLHYSSTFTANLGLLFIVALSFSRNLLVQLLTWVYAPLSALALYAFARSLWGRTVALLAATIILFVPSVLILATITSVDVAVIFYSFLALYALFRWFPSTRRFWFSVAGIFCGVTIGIKYTALALTWAPLELLILIHAAFAPQRSVAAIVRRCVLFGLLVLLCISPWLIRNWVYTNNPLHPFFGSWFHTEAVQFNQYDQVMQRVGNPLHTWYYELRNRQDGDGRFWLKGIGVLLQSPWQMTMTISGAAGKTGVIFLICLPGLIGLIRKKDVIVRYLCVMALSIWLLWALVLPWIHRYGMPLFPSLTLLVAYWIGSTAQGRWKRPVIYSVLNLLLCYHLLLFGYELFMFLRPFPYLFNNQSKAEFLVEHGVEYYPVIAWANGALPGGSKILFEGDVRGFYCEHPYLIHVGVDGVVEEQMILSNLIRSSGTVVEVLQRLDDLGISHILVNTVEMQRLSKKYLHREAYFSFTEPKAQQILEQLFTPNYLRPIRAQEGVVLYEVNYGAGS